MRCVPWLVAFRTFLLSVSGMPAKSTSFLGGARTVVDDAERLAAVYQRSEDLIRALRAFSLDLRETESRDDRPKADKSNITSICAVVESVENDEPDLSAGSAAAVSTEAGFRSSLRRMTSVKLSLRVVEYQLHDVRDAQQASLSGTDKQREDRKSQCIAAMSLALRPTTTIADDGASLSSRSTPEDNVAKTVSGDRINDDVTPETGNDTNGYHVSTTVTVRQNEKSTPPNKTNQYGLNRRQVLVMSICSVVVTTFCSVAMLLRLRNCLRRRNLKRLLHQQQADEEAAWRHQSSSKTGVCSTGVSSMASSNISSASTTTACSSSSKPYGNGHAEQYQPLQLKRHWPIMDSHAAETGKKTKKWTARSNSFK